MLGLQKQKTNEKFPWHHDDFPTFAQGDSYWENPFPWGSHQDSKIFWSGLLSHYRINLAWNPKMGYCSSWCGCQAWVHRSTLSIFCSDTMCFAKSQSLHANLCSEESTLVSGRQIKTSRKVFDGWTISDVAMGMLSNMLWDAFVGALSWFSVQCKVLALPLGLSAPCC